ncbi:hypothetical protein ACE41H_18940 [Paenibacillus enshidis]|uniref:Uncharacterized protein n=1 Tax=Paenibacillus enshidis TaxID=1458439 RepID=A0ABV5AXC3_9BACL
MTLFEELIELLLPHDVIIETSQKTEELFHLFVEAYPVTSWGRVDWKLIREQYSIASVEEAIEILDSKLDESINQQVRLLWNYSDAPSVRVSLKQVVDHIDDVTAVGSDTWLIGPNFSFVIEIFHEGGIKLGFR